MITVKEMQIEIITKLTLESNSKRRKFTDYLEEWIGINKSR